MARANWLPQVLRSAGLTVREQPGWQTRGGDTFDPKGVIIHATAGKLSIESDIRVLLNGSATAPPPIAQLFLARNGEWWVIASGKCYHAMTGRAGNLKGLGNSNLLGIEAANDNRAEPWPAVQYQSYVRGVRAICAHMKWGADRISGHKEHQPPPDKSDPTFDMNAFRSAVANPQGDDVLEDSPAGRNTHDRVYALLAMADAGTGENNDLADAVRAIKADVEALKARPNAVVSLTDQDKSDLIAGFTQAVGPLLAGQREAMRKAFQAGAIVFDADPTNDPPV